MKNVFSWSVLILICMSMCFASGDDPIEAPETNGNPKGGWVYGKVAFPHDLRSLKEYFMLLRAHPGQPVPLITGGYATTDVYVVVRLRGVDTPRALHRSQDRNRPHDWLANERRKWDSGLRYLWNIIEPTKTFRVYNLKVVDRNGDKRLEGDMEIFLGGSWSDVAIMLMNDGHARPEQSDGTEWDWGASTVPLLNPNVPK